MNALTFSLHDLSFHHIPFIALPTAEANHINFYGAGDDVFPKVQHTNIVPTLTFALTTAFP